MSIASGYSQSPDERRRLKTRRRHARYERYRNSLSVPRDPGKMPPGLADFWRYLAIWHTGHINAVPARVLAAHFGVNPRMIMEWKKELVRVFRKPIAANDGYPKAHQPLGRRKKGIFVAVSAEEALEYVNQLSWRIHQIEALKAAFIAAAEKASILRRQGELEFNSGTWLPAYKKARPYNASR